MGHILASRARKILAMNGKDPDVILTGGWFACLKKKDDGLTLGRKKE